MTDLADSWHGYLAVERYTDNLGKANWIKLIVAVRAFVIEVGNGENQYLFQERGNFDKFEVVIDENKSVWYSNIYTCEARYAAGEINFENFKAALVELFGVSPDKVTYTIGTTTIKDRLSCFARFKYLGKNRIRVGLFGCASDSELCKWNQSRVEHNSYIDGNADWNGVE